MDDHRECEMLWAACLNRALKDMFQSKDELLVRDAENWIKDDQRGIGSFRFVCNALDLDPGFVRQTIQTEKGNSWAELKEKYGFRLEKR